jgi:hypothetical protein
MHPFIGQPARPAGWPFSNFPPRRVATTSSPRNIGFRAFPPPPLPSNASNTFFLFPLGSLIKRKLPARGCHRILAFANSRKSLNRNAPNRITFVPPRHAPSLTLPLPPPPAPSAPRAVAETKYRPIAGTARESGSGRVIAFKTWNQLREDSDWY